MYENRVQRILEGLGELGASQILITDSTAVFYITGKRIYPGERFLGLYLTVTGKNVMVVNDLFPFDEDLGVEILRYNDVQDPLAMLKPYVDCDSVMAVDKNMVAGFLLHMMELGMGSQYINGSKVVDAVRQIKDEKEKQLMREVSLINDRVMERLYSMVSGKYSEEEFGEINCRIQRELGCEGDSFPPIIGYGAGAADPHHENDPKAYPKRGDSIIIDIGGICNSYCSDMTRTVFYGEVSEEAKKIYDIVVEANRRGIAAAKPGARFCDVDAAARDYITEMGYGPQFMHRTGHSIGIEDHEYGDVSSTNEQILKPGMCFSVEPGIYLNGRIGVRIEDLVLITEDGCEVLNHFTKDLTIIPVQE